MLPLDLTYNIIYYYSNLDIFSTLCPEFSPSCFTFVFPRLDKVGLSTTYRETKMAVLIFMRKAKKKKK